MKMFVKLSLLLLLSTAGSAFAVSFEANAGYGNGRLFIDAAVDGVKLNLKAQQNELFNGYLQSLVPNKIDIAFLLGGKELDALVNRVASHLPNSPVAVPAWVPVTKSDAVKTAAILAYKLYENSKKQVPATNGKVLQHTLVNAGIEKATEFAQGKLTEYVHKYVPGFTQTVNHDAVKSRSYLSALAQWVAYKTVRFGFHHVAVQVKLLS